MDQVNHSGAFNSNLFAPKTDHPTNQHIPRQEMVAKTLAFSSYQPMLQPLTVSMVYKECLKNHAASLGGHALDGCGEFMPSSADLTDPSLMKCAACGCHRNFHRQDTAEIRRDPPQPQPVILTSVGFTPPHFSLLPRRFASSPSTSRSQSPSPPRHMNPPPPPPPPPPSVAAFLQQYSPGPHMLMALSTGNGASPSHKDYNQNRTKPEQSPAVHSHQTRHKHTPNPNPNPSPSPNSNNHNNSTAKRKRFRSKFSNEQKEKMRRFAEGLNWRMQRNDETLVSEFCADVGVSKGVLKVWMHNNKNTVGKLPNSSNNYSNHSSNNNLEEEENEDHQVNELGLMDHNHHHLGNNGYCSG